MLFERPEIGRLFGMTGLLSKHDLHPDSSYRGCNAHTRSRLYHARPFCGTADDDAVPAPWATAKSRAARR